MCNKDCCAVKTALTIRRMKMLAEKQLKEEAAAPPKKILLTPQSAIFSYEDCKRMADFIIARTEIRPKFGVVCGSNLDMLAQLIENPIVIDYSEIPKFELYTDDLHKSKLFAGTLMGANVIAMQERFHVYEGNPVGSCSMPVRVMKLLGIEYLFVTCASAAVNKHYNVGDIMLVKDHINILGMIDNSPLIGPNDQRFGDRHFSMINAYDQQLIEKAQEIAHEIGCENRIWTGVYCCLGGPAYETPAEHRLLQQIGADTVGMSLVHEVVVARHCSMKVFAYSLVSVPSIDAPQLPEAVLLAQLEDGENVSMELLCRMVYKIHNNL
ncbi:purine nucleoside phosphorylase [Drosophila grimshawi]|uniref:purine-nucleoside phosphorylase n=1 Tax=Drosophila grimshawi TaxID=7222 RepID=B4J872_DROGR|nr:purine nucleoside phosphorylase [Drosophila grimshawi]EDW01209.1 GH20577 [Drosophila grimshawi]